MIDCFVFLLIQNGLCMSRLQLQLWIVNVLMLLRFRS